MDNNHKKTIEKFATCDLRIGWPQHWTKKNVKGKVTFGYVVLVSRKSHLSVLEIFCSKP